MLISIISFTSVAVDLDMTGSVFDLAAFDDNMKKDGFKALFDSQYMSLTDAGKAGKLYYLQDDSWLFMVKVGKETRLYPMALMNWHHIANEVFDKEPIGVSYCLLTGSAVAFNSRLPERKKSFGVAGSLYNSNLVMYDKQTGSLWPQLDLKAYSGVEKDRSLEFFPIGWVTYGYAKKNFASTPVLVGSIQYQDFLEMYQDLPGDYLKDYETSTLIIGPVLPAALADKSFTMKELFILFPKENKAFRFQDAPAFPEWLDVVMENGKITMLTPKAAKTFITLYWFALKAYYPSVKILKANGKQ